MSTAEARGLARIVTPVAPRALLITLVLGLIVAFAVNLAIRWLGGEFLSVPTPAIKTKELIPPTVFPVIGNCFGCFMSWRTPTRQSIRAFLGVGGFMTLVGVAVALLMVHSHSGANAGTYVTGVAVSVAPVLVIVSALLYLVSHQPEVPRPTPWWREQPTV